MPNWNAIQSDDLQMYVRNLRAAGFPGPLTHKIILTENGERVIPSVALKVLKLSDRLRSRFGVVQWNAADLFLSAGRVLNCQLGVEPTIPFPSVPNSIPVPIQFGIDWMAYLGLTISKLSESLENRDIAMSQNQFPKLHNAMWPGLVGKGSPGAEPCIDLDTMLDLTAKAEVNGVKFDGVDIFLFEPHISIDISDSDLKKVADKIRGKGFVIGSVVAPVWPPTGGGSAMGSEEERRNFVTQVQKACRIAKRLREMGVRPYGIVRIDSACGVADWDKDPKGNTKKIAKTFKEAAKVAKDHGERLAAEGEICWGGMHSWKYMVQTLEEVGQPKYVGFQADMAHTLLYTLGYNAPEHRLVPDQFHWEPEKFHAAMKKLTKALRPWTIDFHVAQNDATVRGSGSHDKTGRHCLATDPNGKLNIARDAGYWLRDENGKVTKKFKHICWDGCMFPNDVMRKQQTWNDILAAMIQVRENHGWA